MMTLDCLDVIMLSQLPSLEGRHEGLRRRLDACNPDWTDFYLGIAEVSVGERNFVLSEEGDRGLAVILVPVLNEYGALDDVAAFDPNDAARWWSYGGRAWCLGEQNLFLSSSGGGALKVFESFWELLAADFEGCLVLDDRRAIVEFHLRGIERIAAASERASERLLRRLSGPHLTPQILVPEAA